jgi:hypothetical protein
MIKHLKPHRKSKIYFNQLKDGIIYIFICILAIFINATIKFIIKFHIKNDKTSEAEIKI